MHKKIKEIAGVWSVMALFSCGPDLGSPWLQQEGLREDSVVNGQLESGFPGVGALTYYIPGYGYQGSFCTGTLITSNWVLTAAHCLTEHEGMQLEPSFVNFYVGSDARPSGGGMPAGNFYQADSFVIHEHYSSSQSTNDIGLVHLSETASSVTPYAYNTSAMTNHDFSGELAKYVGFGATEGVNSTGGGQKRSTSLNIYNVESSSYMSNYAATTSGICFGDSGGPGLYQFGSEWKVIGVNSTVAGSGTGDPCREYYNHMRVDAYSGWIAGIIGAPPPSCTNNPDMCYCAAACQSNGTCNNTVCQTLDCEAIYDCMTDCSDNIGCQSDCYQNGTTDGKSKLDAMFDCFNQHCDGRTGDAFQTCVNSNCSTQISTCMPVSTGNDTCEQVYDCIAACPTNDSTCTGNCYENGTATAQQQLDAMYQCFDDQCSGQSGDAWQTCVQQNCRSQIDTCMPPTNCDITGGDCPSGRACYPTTGGSYDCFPTDGLALGASCDSSNNTQLYCADGMLCLGAGSNGTCLAFCTGQSDCASDETCRIPVFTDVSDVGYCEAGSTGTDGGTSTPDSGGSSNPTCGPTGKDYMENCSSNSECKCGICRGVDGFGQICLTPCDPRLGHYDCPTNDYTGCVPNDVNALNFGGECQPKITTGSTLDVGATCNAHDGFKTCKTGLCEGGVCLVPCNRGTCPDEFSCDTSEVSDPGICRPAPTAPLCGCSADAADAPGQFAVAMLVLGLLVTRRRKQQ